MAVDQRTRFFRTNVQPLLNNPVRQPRAAAVTSKAVAVALARDEEEPLVYGSLSLCPTTNLLTSRFSF